MAALLVSAAETQPPVAVLGLLYVVTAVLTNVSSNNATVVLMIPVAVTFAASTAFVTPVGYQTGRFVYGPGGYCFTDDIRVGGPLQAVFAVVPTLGIAAICGI